MSKARTKNRNARPFTLVEVVAALALLAMVSATLMVAVGRSTRASGEAARMLQTTTLCASHAAAIRAGIRVEDIGPVGHDPTYHQEITQLAPPDGAPEGLRIFHVTISPAPEADAETTTEMTVWVPHEKPEDAE